MNQKRTYRQYDETFKKDAVNLVLKEGYSVAQAAKSLDVAPGLLYKWKAEQTQESVLDNDEKAELKRLRKENRELKMEKEILKKASAYFARHVK